MDHFVSFQQVKQSVSGAKVSPKVAGLLERIADYPNIPRKKAKFEVSIDNLYCMKLTACDGIFFIVKYKLCRILCVTVLMFEIKGLSLNFGMPSVGLQKRCVNSIKRSIFTRV